MSMISEKLKELRVVLPKVGTPAGNYLPAVRSDRLIFSSGQVPRVDGAMMYEGKLGDTVSDSDGYDAARVCTINCLSAIDYLAGGLDNIERVIKVTCFISSTPDFTAHAAVANGATDLLGELFGKAGIPARSAVGMSSLPSNAAVEVEMVAQVKDINLCRDF